MNMLATMGVLLFITTSLQADPPKPTRKDAKIDWVKGYPKVEKGKVLLKGTIEVHNGYEWLKEPLLITFAPRPQGVGAQCEAKVNEKGEWETNIDTDKLGFNEYDVVAFIHITNKKDKKIHLWTSKPIVVKVR